MLKATIKIGIEGNKIRQYVSAQARHLVRDSLFADHTLNLVMFPHDSSKIVTSKAVAKMLSKITNEENMLVVVGWDFTNEARLLLNTSNAKVLSDRDYGWTDERWAAIKE